MAGPTERVLLALEGAAATDPGLRAHVARLRSEGFDVIEPPLERALGRPAGPRLVLVVPVVTADDASRAVQAALRGFGLVAVNHADRATADRLYDDLRRFGRLVVRSVLERAPAEDLDADQRALLDLLASGLSLGEAATSLHLSRRTADRRLAAARRALGAATTLEAIARLRTPPAA